MGSFLKSGQVVLEIFEFFVIFFRQDLEGTYISEMAPKGQFLKTFLYFSGNKHS